MASFDKIVVPCMYSSAADLIALSEGCKFPRPLSLSCFPTFIAYKGGTSSGNTRSVPRCIPAAGEQQELKSPACLLKRLRLPTRDGTSQISPVTGTSAAASTSVSDEEENDASDDEAESLDGKSPERESDSRRTFSDGAQDGRYDEENDVEEEAYLDRQGGRDANIADPAAKKSDTSPRVNPEGRPRAIQGASRYTLILLSESCHGR